MAKDSIYQSIFEKEYSIRSSSIEDPALSSELSKEAFHSKLMEYQGISKKIEKEFGNNTQNDLPVMKSNYLVGKSRSMLKVLDLVKKVGPTDSTILITGESGVGKELIAQELYRLSNRKDAPFIKLNIAALAPGLITSELFGHEKGAFTGANELMRGRFELANKGTLFLDEIGELCMEDQVRLLRVLQEGVFERIGGGSKPIKSDFRLITATNHDLLPQVRAGKFRMDLYYRLNVFPIKVPPLRDRKEDIEVLALFFMEKYGCKFSRKFDGISDSDMNRLIEYKWPGNIRELMHIIERAAILSEGPRLIIPELTHDEDLQKAGAAAGNKDKTLAEVEREYILEILQKTGGRITGSKGAAERLNLKPSTLLFRIKKLRLQEELEKIREMTK